MVGLRLRRDREKIGRGKESEDRMPRTMVQGPWCRDREAELEGLAMGRAALPSPGPTSWPGPAPIEPHPRLPSLHPQTPADTGPGCRGPEPLAFDTGD